jgi:uncharacterized protein (TIGR02145 family)
MKKLLVSLVAVTALISTAYGVCTQDVNMSGNMVKDLGTPTDPNDAATKAYVDSMAGGGTTYETITYNSKTWLDRNLGAARVAENVTDYHAYGDLYQWGRTADGHQTTLRASASLPNGTADGKTRSATATQAASSTPNNGQFITGTDWLATADATLWDENGTGAGEVCPAGYHVPTETEFGTFTDRADAFTKLKLTAAGSRNHSNATLYNVGTNGYYWASSVDGTNSRSLYIGSGSATFNSHNRAYGFSVRCVAN